MSTAHELQSPVEADRISLLVVWGCGIGFAVGVVICSFVALGLMNAWAKGEPLHRGPAPRASAEIGIVEQALVRDSRRGLDEKEAQRRDLMRWGWADRGKGIARIPIDRAMDLAADREFAARVRVGTPVVPPGGPER
jgi:hypothetical protein